MRSPAALAPTTCPTRRGRVVVAVPADGNAHVAAGRPWTEADRAAVRRDAVGWAAAFRRVTPCPVCLWPYALPCNHRAEVATS